MQRISNGPEPGATDWTTALFSSDLVAEMLSETEAHTPALVLVPNCIVSALPSHYCKSDYDDLDFSQHRMRKARTSTTSEMTATYIAINKSPQK